MTPEQAGATPYADGDLMRGAPDNIEPLPGRRPVVRARWSLLTHAEAQRVAATLSVTAALLALVALADIAIRAAVRLDWSWDTVGYHLAYAAARGGIRIPFELSDTMRPPFEGYPPLPHFVQGVLWRLTGSVHATGVVNYVGFVGFLVYCQRVLRAPFWLVALLSLSAPLVVIHASTSYIDLFGNSFLAAGVCSCLYVFLFPDEQRRAVLLGGLVGLAAATWCKYLLVPVAVPVFVAFVIMVSSKPRTAGFCRRHAALLWVAAALVGAVPYVKNWAVYGNPFWPIRLPLIGDLFPYLNDPMQSGAIAERPGTLKDVSQAELFFRSLFEIGVPTGYLWRPRWIIDQGDSQMYRMGGFWGVAVATYLATLFVALLASHRRRGLWASVGVLGLLGLVAVLPQSHELRYYQFLPLSGAAAIGLLFPRLKEIAPQATLLFQALVIGLFVHMVSENWVHYRIERLDYSAAAYHWNAAAWWPRLERGKTYCAVDLRPIAFLLTGPTRSEYRIVDRSRSALCPAGSIVLTR